MARKSSDKHQKLDSLAGDAKAALEKGDWFAADRAAFEGVTLAYAMDEYARMPAILELLKEARGRRFRQALEIGTLTIIDDPELRNAMLDEETPMKLEPGCYLVQPPLVGADGRNLRDHFFSFDIPALFMVREPLTQAGLVPLVMVGPITVRARVEPYEGDAPSLEWLEDAAYELGDAAIETINPEASASVRVNELLDRLGTVVLHDSLIDLLAETSLEAQAELDAERAAKAEKADRAEEAEKAKKAKKAAGA